MGRVTLWGFYQFSDKTLFDNAPLYEGFDKQILIDLIMQQSGELFPFHQQPDYLKQNITNWFTRMYEQFKRMHVALYSEYNPIENYDRHEDWSDSESVSASMSESLSTSESESTSSSGSAHDSTSDSTSNSLDNGISAANMATGYLPDTASQGRTAGVSSSDSDNETATNRLNDLASKRHNIESREHYSTHGGRIHGNIGVTTNQQMIEAELNLRKYDIYQTIADMFEKEFIVRVY